MSQVENDYTEYRRAGHATETYPRLINPRLILEIAEVCEEKGWRTPGERGDKDGYQFGAYTALAHSEITEALEAYRDKTWSDTCEAIEPGQEHHKSCSGKPHDHPKPVGVGPEMADALIRILDMVDLWEIDIEYELRRVLDQNWARPYRHGGREL